MPKSKKYNNNLLDCQCFNADVREKRNGIQMEEQTKQAKKDDTPNRHDHAENGRKKLE